MAISSCKQNGSPAILREGAIVDCDTTNRRGVSGVWHKVFRKSRLLPNFSIWHYWQSNVFVWVFPFMLRCWYNFFSITFTILDLLYPFPSLVRTWKKLTNTPSVTSLTHPPLTVLPRCVNEYAQFHYKGIRRVRWIMFTSLISQYYSLILHHKYKMR